MSERPAWPEWLAPTEAQLPKHRSARLYLPNRESLMREIVAVMRGSDDDFSISEMRVLVAADASDVLSCMVKLVESGSVDVFNIQYIKRYRWIKDDGRAA